MTVWPSDSGWWGTLILMVRRLTARAVTPRPRRTTAPWIATTTLSSVYGPTTTRGEILCSFGGEKSNFEGDPQHRMRHKVQIYEKRDYKKKKIPS